MNRKRDIYTEAHNLYYPIVFGAVYTKVNNVDDARDICQEVFLIFYEKFGEIENHRKWLFGALRLAVFEFYRKRKKGEALDIDEIFNDVSLTFVNGFRDARIIISEAFENIENFQIEEDKILFDLVAFSNYSYSHVAEHLGLTKRKVEYRYRRIVEKILDYLKSKGIENIEDLL